MGWLHSCTNADLLNISSFSPSQNHSVFNSGTSVDLQTSVFVSRSFFSNVWDTGHAAFYITWTSIHPVSILIIFLLPASCHHAVFPDRLSHVRFIYYWAHVKSSWRTILNVLQHSKDLKQGHRLLLLRNGLAGRVLCCCIWLCWWHNDVFANAMGAVGMHLRDWRWCRKGIKYERCCIAKNNDIPI